MAVFDTLLTSDRVLDATAADAWLGALLRFERELAAAQEALGIIPAGSADAVARAIERAELTPRQLALEGRASGNLVIPLVRALRAAGAPGTLVHHGATSQDAMDTASVLVASRAAGLVLDDLRGAGEACASLAGRHRGTLMTARTLLQPALPTTFGVKAAAWLVALTGAAEGLRRAVSENAALQLGGAAGTLAAFGEKGPALSAALAARLGLRDPALPWHTDRSRLLRLGASLVEVANACAKVALDVALLAQAEVGELSEGGAPGRGGSSSMPQKANPVGSVGILAAARHAHGACATLASAGVQDHERAGTGGWHAEWAPITTLLRAAGGCASSVRGVLADLVVHDDRMAANLAARRGLVTAERVALDLTPDLGPEVARDVVARAGAEVMREGRSLPEVLGSLPEVAALRSAEQLDALCDPAGYLGAVDELVDRALAVYARSVAPTEHVAPGEGPASDEGR